MTDNGDLSGQTIKGYELQDRIGAGGFGAVYRATDTRINRIVAVKILKPDIKESDAAILGASALVWEIAN